MDGLILRCVEFGPETDRGAAGVAIGTLLGVAVTVLFRSQLYGISAVEWTVLVPVGATMLALCLLVAYFSARPWITINPMEAVRHV